MRTLSAVVGLFCVLLCLLCAHAAKVSIDLHYDELQQENTPRARLEKSGNKGPKTTITNTHTNKVLKSHGSQASSRVTADGSHRGEALHGPKYFRKDVPKEDRAHLTKRK